MITRGMEIASKGMQSLLDLNDTIANNLANVNTPGFKKASLLFKSVYNSQIEQATNPNDAKNTDYRALGSISMGSATDRSVVTFTQGILDRTNNPLDAAIEGDGFFKVQNNDGQIAYTRDGQFTINNNKQLTTLDGDLVLDDKSKPIVVDLGQAKATHQDIIIKEDGGIVINNLSSPQTLQTIGIYDFADKNNMIPLGNAKYIPVDSMNVELKSEKFTIQQGARELSNANVITEMINSINVSRNYETLSKYVKSDSDLLDRAIGLSKIQA